MYGALAPWFHLLTPPGDYADEAADILDVLRGAVRGPLRDLLELGAGGGKTASHLDPAQRLTLTDLSPAMLEVSRTINPDAEHIVGDMRTLRLDRTFDVVLVHDAIGYMTTREDLRAAFETVAVHLRPGGAAIVLPDHVADAFEPSTDHGGTDERTPDGRPGRGVRYLEWADDADPDDEMYETEFVIVVRDPAGRFEIHHDRHVEGLFAIDTWLRLMRDAGLRAEARPDPWGRTTFVGRRPQSSP
jgi:hypothetical protein